MSSAGLSTTTPMPELAESGPPSCESPQALSVKASQVGGRPHQPPLLKAVNFPTRHNFQWFLADRPIWNHKTPTMTKAIESHLRATPLHHFGQNMSVCMRLPQRRRVGRPYLLFLLSSAAEKETKTAASLGQSLQGFSPALDCLAPHQTSA